MAGWENGTGFRLLPKRAKAGRVRCLQLACGWCQARTLQVSPIS